MELALYKGPPDGFLHTVGHWAVRVFTWSKYSHVELVINGECFSSSNRDGGVRGRIIDLTSGRWDVYPIKGNTFAALSWFANHHREKYDWPGVLRFALPFLPKRPKEWFCSEACAAALGLEHPETYTPQSLLDRLKA